MSDMKKSDLSKYMATIGAKGGRVGGATKARSPEHYRKMVEARNRKKTMAE